MADKPKLPAYVKGDVQRILDRAARRLLNERLARKDRHRAK
jgi:hypothetical protein